MKIAIFFVLLFAQLSQVIAGGDASLGKSTAIICAGCHERDGNSTNSEYPKLSAQSEAYMIKQLMDFKQGAREDSHMSPIVQALSLSDVPNVAAYFSQQTRLLPAADDLHSTAGKAIYSAGIAAKNVTACAACHGADGLGNPAAGFPLLAGQHADYISKQLKDFRNATRHNDAQNMMRTIAVNLTDEDIATLSAYVAMLR